MKKSLFTLVFLLLLVGVGVAHAQETGSSEATGNSEATESIYLNMFKDNKDFSTYKIPGEWFDSIPRRMITVNITASPEAPAKVYITNFVDHVEPDEYGVRYGVVTDLGAADYLYGYDMGSGKYGYVMAEIDDDGNATPILSTLTMSDGTHTTINYTYTTTEEDADGNDCIVEYPVQTEGYYLGEFTENCKIFLIMTPRGFNAVNTYDPVANSDSTYPEIKAKSQADLASRQLNTKDQLSYIRVNLGLFNDDGNHGLVNGSHEFVIGYQVPTGSPLPGSLLSSLVFMGTAAIGARFRKRSKK